MNLSSLNIEEARNGLLAKKFSVFELVSDIYQRIELVENKVKAFVSLNKEQALDEAKKIDLKGYDKNIPLLGIPISIKDNFLTKNIKTTASSIVLGNYHPPYNATVVNKIIKAGGIIIGKTNMDAWAHGSSTETSDYGPTHNPWNLDKLPGGSSGGSAASIMADETIGSIGSETAGSIRQPASWCGVVGFKPTYGRVSRSGLIAMVSSFDCPGPITKTVKDAAILLNIIAGKDPLDATTSFLKVPDYENIETTGKIKIGIPKEYFGKGISPEVKIIVLKAIDILKKKGAIIKEIDLFDPKYAISVYTILQRSEVSSNLGRYDGIRFGLDRHSFHAEAKRRIMLGTYALSSGYYDAYYLNAQKIRTIICQDFEEAFKEVDLIIGPTTPVTALPIGSTDKNPMFGEVQDMLVEPSTIAGLPGISLPCGFSKDNLPVGMQIVGPQFREQLIFSLANQYEQETQWHKMKPKL